MNILKPTRVDSDRDKSRQYVPIRHKNGKVTCSCGRELVKLDERTYRCAAGWPMYRFDDGDIIKTKDGQLLMRQKDHG